MPHDCEGCAHVSSLFARAIPYTVPIRMRRHLAEEGVAVWRLVEKAKGKHGICYAEGTAVPNPPECGQTPIHAFAYINEGFVGMWEWLCEACYTARVEEEADIVAEVLAEELEAACVC